MTNNILTNYPVFDDVAVVILEEENKHKNKEDKQASSQQVEALKVIKGKSIKHGPNGSQNQGKSKLKSKNNFKCFNYGKKSHLKKDC